MNQDSHFSNKVTLKKKSKEENLWEKYIFYADIRKEVSILSIILHTYQSPEYYNTNNNLKNGTQKLKKYNKIKSVLRQSK